MLPSPYLKHIEVQQRQPLPPAPGGSADVAATAGVAATGGGCTLAAVAAAATAAAAASAGAWLLSCLWRPRLCSWLCCAWGCSWHRFLQEAQDHRLRLAQEVRVESQADPEQQAVGRRALQGAKRRAEEAAGAVKPAQPGRKLYEVGRGPGAGSRGVVARRRRAPPTP